MVNHPTDYGYIHHNSRFSSKNFTQFKTTEKYHVSLTRFPLKNKGYTFSSFRKLLLK